MIVNKKLKLLKKKIEIVIKKWKKKNNKNKTNMIENKDKLNKKLQVNKKIKIKILNKQKKNIKLKC